MEMLTTSTLPEPMVCTGITVSELATATGVGAMFKSGGIFKYSTRIVSAAPLVVSCAIILQKPLRLF